jgi:hypothetical protein
MLTGDHHLCRKHFGLEGSGELFRFGKPQTEVGPASLPTALEACNLHLRRRAKLNSATSFTRQTIFRTSSLVP